MAGADGVAALPFLRGFVRLCDDGWHMGWHERNGGNLSYRMDAGDVAACSPCLAGSPGAWVPLPADAVCPDLGGAWFAVTGSGRFMRNAADDPVRSLGIVELDGRGAAYRVRWGLEGCSPTSELPTHLVAHAVRAGATDGAARVVYHAHTPNLIALTYVVPCDDRSVTRALWKTMPECAMTFPAGVGVVPWTVPGGVEIARLSADKLRTYAAVVWALHGTFCTGADFDQAFGLMHTLEKAAQIYRYACQMAGGAGFSQTIPDEGLRAIGVRYDMPVNEAFLD